MHGRGHAPAARLGHRKRAASLGPALRRDGGRLSQIKQRRRNGHPLRRTFSTTHASCTRMKALWAAPPLFRSGWHAFACVVGKRIRHGDARMLDSRNCSRLIATHRPLVRSLHVLLAR